MNTQTNKQPVVKQPVVQSIVWGSLFILFGLLSLAELYFDLGVWLWIIILSLAGLGTFLVYLTDRNNWPLLIPTYVLWAIAALATVLLLELLRSELVTLFVLTAIALPFIVVFLYDRRNNWWALIPACILLGIGSMVTLIEYSLINDALIPAYVMFIIAVPFLVVYALNREEKWPLIPAGIMLIIGFSFLMATTLAPYIIGGLLIVVGSLLIVRQLRQPHEKPIKKFK